MLRGAAPQGWRNPLQDLDRVPSSLGHRGGRHGAVEPGGHGRVPKVVGVFASGEAATSAVNAACRARRHTRPIVVVGSSPTNSRPSGWTPTPRPLDLGPAGAGQSHRRRPRQGLPSRSPGPGRAAGRSQPPLQPAPAPDRHRGGIRDVTLTKQQVREVLDVYIRAWEDQDPDLICTIFTEGCRRSCRLAGRCVGERWGPSQGGSASSIRSRLPCFVSGVPDQAAEVRRPGSWLRWVAPAAQWPMSKSPAMTTQNQSHPVRPRPGL
jgi:hypothetical protein